MMSNPALFDLSIEFLEYNDKMYFVQSGKNLPLSNLPDEPRTIVLKEMNDHPYSQQAFEYWGITDVDKQLEKFTKCQFGLGNNTPDIDVNGRLSQPEYKYCSERGQCDMNGKFCAGIALKNGCLTKREVEVTTLVGLGLPDKVICDEMNISQDTLRNHKNHIEQKADINGKVQIAWIAFEFQLVQKKRN